MPKVETRFHFRNREIARTRPRNAELMVRGLLVAAAFTLIGATAFAQAAPRPEALIKWRQSAFQVIGWSSTRLKTALSGKYDSHEVQSAARSLAAVANSGLDTLFPAGTADGKGWRETTARDEVFSDAQKFRALTEDFAREANTLATLAARGDVQAVNAQFLKVAQTCKSCHNRFRDTE
jgi:cytochrome c556